MGSFEEHPLSFNKTKLYGEIMGSLKNILIHCQENEKDFEMHGIASSDRTRNQGWIECCEFFLRNFELTEKPINEQKGETNGTV